LPEQYHLTSLQIPWDGAVRAGNLTEDQLKRIRSVDKVRKDQRKQTIDKDVNIYSALLVGGSSGGNVLEKASKRSDIIQYILVLAADLINGTAPLDLSSQAYS
jgi:V-type H+-transporting ATPase subunit H